MHTLTNREPIEIECNVGSSRSFLSVVDKTALTLAILAPALVFLASLNQLKLLFWFGDEIHLLSEIRHQGYWSWVTSNFAENFVPLFKLLWGGAALVFHGSYFAMMCILWITHLLNSLLLATLLLRLGVPALGTAFAVITFSITHSTHESLGWTVQWSAVLATTFFIAAFHILLTCIERNKISTIAGALYFLSLLASAFCFSRGILVCATVGFAAFLWSAVCFFDKKSTQALPFLCISGIALIPACISVTMIFLSSTGNHQSLLNSEHSALGKIALFALHAFGMNPLSRLFGDDTVSWEEFMLCLLIKVTCIVWSLILSRRLGNIVLVFLLSFLAFDIGNSLLLGIGRHHTELRFAIGSRYQYEFLITFAPFLAILFGELAAFLKNRFSEYAASISSLVLIGLWAALLGVQWKGTLNQWTGWHGTEGRRALLEMSSPPPGMTGNQLWLGIPPIISYEEAKTVTQEFHLH